MKLLVGLFIGLVIRSAAPSSIRVTKRRALGGLFSISPSVHAPCRKYFGSCFDLLNQANMKDHPIQ